MDTIKFFHGNSLCDTDETFRKLFKQKVRELLPGIPIRSIFAYPNVTYYVYEGEIKCTGGTLLEEFINTYGQELKIDIDYSPPIKRTRKKK